MGSRTQAVAMIVLSLFALAGCRKDVVQPTLPNEYKEGLKYVKAGWLEDCPSLGSLPGHTAGDLLQDLADIAVLASECRERHRSFVEYMRPLVEKAKKE